MTLREAKGLILVGLVALGAYTIPFEVGSRPDESVVLKRAGGLEGWRGLLVGSPLNINTATTEDLTALPGVGAHTAKMIVATRSRLGGFGDLQELRFASGVGKVKMKRLTDWLVLE